MSEVQSPTRHGPYQRQVEIGVAIATAVFGAVAVIGSLQVGIGWGAEGPQAGFFPFYVGLIIILSSAVNFWRIFGEVSPTTLFADWEQLRAVGSIIGPTTVYALAMPYTGLYLGSFLLIALFMKWLGRYSWALTLGIAAAVPVLVYFMFEKWFLVPLPKGPIEEWLVL